MKNRHHIVIKSLFALTFWFLQWSVFAQGNFPVRVIANVNAPASSSLEDYANPVKTPVRVNLQLQDLRLGSRAVFLKVGIQGPGVSIQSSESASLTQINLVAGSLVTVPAATLAAYFSPASLLVPPALYNRPLPSGLYTFTFEVFDELTKSKLSDRISTPPVWIETSQPPVLVMPQDAKDLAVSQVQNVLFQWTPRHTQINDVEYEFILTELPVSNRGNIQNIFLSQPPLYKGIVSSNNFLYDAKFPPLREGYTYAWRVQAKTKLGREARVGTFANNGISEIFSFTYIRPMLAPTGLKASWGADFKNLTVVWKGSQNHTKYVVRVKSGGKIIKETNVSKSFSDDYALKVANISPVSAYEVTVQAVDRFYRTADATPVNVNANSLTEVTKRLMESVELKGQIKWAFKQSEENVRHQDGLLATSIRTRETSTVRLQSVAQGSKVYDLKDATVLLYGSANPVNAQNMATFTSSLTKMALLESAKSAENGEYSFKALKVAQLTGYNYYYTLVRYKDSNFSPVAQEVIIDEKADKQRDLKTVTLLANTVRFTPKLVVPSNIRENDLEEIALYRLKSVFDANKSVLAGEAERVTAAEIEFNKAKYVRTVDLKSGAGRIFDNEFVKDQFILVVKQVNRKPVIYPISGLKGSKEAAEVASIRDYIKYTPPPLTLSGVVAFGTATTNVKANRHTVGIFIPTNSSDIGRIEREGMSPKMNILRALFATQALTDARGEYKIDLPESMLGNPRATKWVIYAVDPVNSSVLWTKVVDAPKKDITQDFYLKTAGATLASVVKDQFNRPVRGASVTHASGLSTKTDENGFFQLSFLTKKMLEDNPTVSIQANDYKAKSVVLGSFDKKTIQTPNDFGKSFWIKTMTDYVNGAVPAAKALITETAFREMYQSKNANVETIYTVKTIEMESNQVAVRFKTSRTTDGKKEFVAATIRVNGELVQTAAAGTLRYLKAGTLTVDVVNPNPEAEILYLEESASLPVPIPASRGQIVEVTMEVKEAFRVAGKVEGNQQDGSKKPLEGVSFKLVGLEKSYLSKADGSFSMLIEKSSKEDNVEASLKGYNVNKFALNKKKADGIDLKNLKITLDERNKAIPDFKKLQGFEAIIETAEKLDGDTYQVTGSLTLADDVGSFKLAAGEKITFTKMNVTKDKKDEENAVLAEGKGEFDQTVLNLILFNYAPIELSTKSQKISIEPISAAGQVGKGKIGGTIVKFKPKRFLGATPQTYMQEVDLKLAETDFKNSESNFSNTRVRKADSNDLFAVFVSGNQRVLTNDEFAKFDLVFPNVKSIGTTAEEGTVPISAGPGGIFILDMKTKGAILSREGIEFDGGELKFPLMAMIGMKSRPKVQKLVIDKTSNFDLKELSFVKENDGNFAVLGMQKSWRLEINKLQIFDNFKNYGIGGKLYTDKDNHLIINSMSFTKVGSDIYPNISMKFPEAGFKIKSLVLKSPKNQDVVFQYNKEDAAYEIDAGVRIEVGATAGETLKKIFPLEAERFFYNTAGKFYVAIKVGNPIEVGPVKINIRKLIFNKGGTVSWSAMLNSLEKTEEEDKAFFNSASAKFSKPNTASPDPNAYADVVLTDSQVNWAFGFAGGVQLDQLKGGKFKSDAAFVVGDKGRGVEIEFGSIDLAIEQSSFKAYASIKLATSGEKVGFEGKGGLETMSRSFDASLKFYKLPRGIEFGATVAVSTSIVTGSITWTKIGGGVDFNTQDNKYKVIFLGAATPTGTPASVTEFKNITVSVLFETNTCGPKPVVEGSLDWFNQRSFYCNAKVKLDFCRMLLLGTIDCQKEIYEGTNARLNATVFFTTRSLFVGASVQTQVLGANVNGSFMFGVENNFNDGNTPAEVRRYAGMIRRDYLDNNGSTLNGVYLKASLDSRGSSSGNYWIASYSVSYSVFNEFELLYAWKSGNFFLRNNLNASFDARASLLGATIHGGAGIRLDISGGRNNYDGWFFNASGGISAYMNNGGGENLSCNSQLIKACYTRVPCGLSCCCGRWWRPRAPRCSVNYCNMPYPCGVSFKVCLNLSFRASYSQKRGGWRYGL